MGEAKRRGSFEDRKRQALYSGRRKCKPRKVKKQQGASSLKVLTGLLLRHGGR